MSSALAYSGKKAILFSDFDGTITLRDSNDWMTDNIGFGAEKRRQLNIDILEGRVGFRDAFRDMLESVNANTTFEDAKARVTEAIALDGGFKPFLEWAKTVDMPIVIVSSGMVPVISSIFSNLVGKEEAAKIEIIANNATVLDDGHFKVEFKHPDSHYGHDKSKALRPYAELPADQKPIIFFCGDGVSDMSAAGESDVLFVKINPHSSNDLAEHCAKENIPYLPFLDFTQVQELVSKVLSGEISVADINANKIRVEAVDTELKRLGKSLPAPKA